MLNVGSCPYCGEGIAGKRTKDHVFVHALGGKATVAACDECNGLINRRIETPLQKAGTLLHLAKLLRGEIEGPVAGTMKDTGLKVERDPATNTVQPMLTHVHDGEHLMGTADQVERYLVDQGHTKEQAEALVRAHGQRQSTLGDTVLLEVKEDTLLAQRLVAKVALGAGALAGGLGFVESPLAAKLRDVMWAEAESSSLVNLGGIAALDEMMSSTLTRAGAAQIPTLAPPSGRNAATFIHVGYDRVGIFARLYDLDIAYCGLVLEGELPFGQHLPVQVLDGAPRPHVRRVIDDLAVALRTSTPSRTW